MMLPRTAAVQVHTHTAHTRARAQTHTRTHTHKHKYTHMVRGGTRLEDTRYTCTHMREGEERERKLERRKTDRQGGIE